MRILAISDSHGDSRRFLQVVEKHSDIDTVLFLGDGIKDMEFVSRTVGRRFYYVRGNCDYNNEGIPASLLFELEEKKIFITHGHEYYVKYGLGSLIAAANARMADIVLFGHTHEPLIDYINGLYVVNPGSLGSPRYGKPTYAIIDLSKSGIMPNLIEM